VTVRTLTTGTRAPPRFRDAPDPSINGDPPPGYPHDGRAVLFPLPEHRGHTVQAAVANSDNHEGGPSWI